MIFQQFWFRSFLSVLFYIWLILDPAKLASTKLQLKWFMGSWIWVVELLCDIKYRIEMIPSDDVAIGIDCKGSEILVALYIIYVTLELKVASAKAWSHFDWITFLRFPIIRGAFAKTSFDFCTKINIARLRRWQFLIIDQIHATEKSALESGFSQNKKLWFFK